MPRNYGERRYKAAVRARQFSGIAPTRCILTLPGVDLACVVAMREIGLIGAETRQLWAEHDRDKFEAIRSNAVKLGVTPEILHHGDVRRWVPPEVVDVVNLDLEEGFGVNLGEWLEHVSEHRFADDTTLFVTLIRKSRNGVQARFTRWFGEYSTSNAAIRDCFERVITPAMNHWSPEVHRVLVLLACAMPGFHVHADMIDEYQDGMPMVSYRLRLTRAARSSAIPRFTELVQLFMPGYQRPTWTRAASADEDDAGRVKLPNLGDAGGSKFSGQFELSMVEARRQRRLAQEAEMAEVNRHIAALMERKAEIEADLASADEVVETADERYRRVRHLAAVKAAATRRSRRADQ